MFPATANRPPTTPAACARRSVPTAATWPLTPVPRSSPRVTRTMRPTSSCTTGSLCDHPRQRGERRHRRQRVHADDQRQRALRRVSVPTPPLWVGTASASTFSVRDRQTGTTEQIDLAPDGSAPDGDAAFSPQLSDDGRFVFFTSLASNLTPGVPDEGGLDAFCTTAPPAPRRRSPVRSHRPSWAPSPTASLKVSAPAAAT